MIETAFLDLDGTVYIDGTIIDSVDLQIRRLTALGVRFYYMTNNSSLSTEQYREKLRKLNLPVDEFSVISPTVVLSDWLSNKGIRKAFSVGTFAFRQELAERAGVQQDLKDPSCVIIGFDKELNYEKLTVACRLINEGVPYYLTHVDLACPTLSGPIPDCGAIGRMIEAATGVQPLGHFGKPGDHMLSHVKQLSGSSDKALVAGDRYYTDAEMGLRLGATVVLVCSGEYKRGSSPVSDSVQVWDTLSEFLKTV